VTYEDWKKMTRKERDKAGLAVSPVGGWFDFKRFRAERDGYTIKRK
jgi:hypothetical protein